MAGGGGEYCRICEAEEGGVKVEDGQGVGVVVKGEKKGEMDVIAVPCEWGTDLQEEIELMNHL